MMSFSVSGPAYRKDGEMVPFHADVIAPERSGALFSCTLDWVGEGRFQFTSPFSETAYRRACGFVRRRLWQRELVLLDASGCETAFMPPVFLPRPVGSKTGGPIFSFDVAEFDCFAQYPGGESEPFLVRIGPPFNMGDAFRFGSSCFFSWHGELGPIFGTTPDEAYSWAFRLIRRLLRHAKATTLDAEGRPVIITAPGAGA